MTITFETKVWENDWELILKTDRLDLMIKRCNHSFSEKILYINNVSDLHAVCHAAEKLVAKKIITKYVNVEDHAQAAMQFFSLSREKLGKGYYYSIAELVSIYLTKTEYLLHFSGDSIVSKGTPKNWLNEGIKTLKNNSNVKVFNLTWNKKYKEAKKESKFEDKVNFYGNGFSDQMYLVRTAELKDSIYDHYHPDSERYPVYGGELFEKRIYSWLRAHSYLRATYKHGSYLHKNFPKSYWKQKISILLKSPNLFHG